MLPLAAPAHVDLRYATVGEDVYRLEPGNAVSRVTYVGIQHVAIVRSGGALRFEARVRYARTGPAGTATAEAHFVQTLAPNGAFEDRSDDDPDFLTILNQPFAVKLDAATLRDVRALRGRVPFAATSPLGGSVLRGYLRPGVNGPIENRPTAAVRFEAAGPMNGALPSHADATVTGAMRMEGTAYYSLRDAVLMALNVNLSIDARLRQGEAATSVPVRITYHRWIRAAFGTDAGTVAR